MRNIRKHVEFSAILHLARSVLFYFRKNVIIESKSTRYLGLCSYIHFFTSILMKKGSEVVFKNKGFLVFGTEVSSFKGWAGRSKLHMESNSKLIINNEVWIGRGSLVWLLEGGVLEFSGQESFTAGKNIIICKDRVQIGSRVQIAWGVTITDHDFHKLYESDGSQRLETSPVVICDDVWIGMNVTILKGVTIGKGAVIGAESIVTKDVPPKSLVAGNPAKIIKSNIDFRG